MKPSKHGPTGTLAAQTKRGNESVCLRLSFALPNGGNWTVRACLGDRSRNRLKGSAECPSTTFEQPLAPVPEGLEAEVICDQRHWFSEDFLTAWQAEFVIPIEQIRRIGYLTVYVGDTSLDSESSWHLRPDTILLEADRAAWGLNSDSVSASFLLMSRGDATGRLNFLHESHRVLQAHREDVANTMFDIFFLLIGGRDIQLMTCDLEGLTHEE
ncbi:MAG: hypothetical protein ABJZ55_16540 [Fuerstiella sp.]